MNDTSPRMITQLLGNRKMFLELIIAAIVLALSVNIIAGAVLQLNWINPLWAFALASTLTLVCTLYFIGRLLWTSTHKHEFQGFIICSKKNNELIDVPRYDYANELHSFMTAAFAENAAIKNLWSKDPLAGTLHFDPKTGDASHAKGKAHQLIVEATEYYVLDKLSVHLTDYFNRPGFDEKELHTFARNDIPDVLLSNRFLELFSKPMEDRPLFSAEDNTGPGGVEVVMATGEQGAFFSRFELTLPKGAYVWRNRDNEIVIHTGRFTLTVAVDFEGCGAIVPREYQRHILGIDPMEYSHYEVRVAFEVSFKFAALFLPGGWDYYRWVESFMQSFEAEFSRERHFSTIGWESALTLIEYHERHKQVSPRDKGSQQVASGED